MNAAQAIAVGGASAAVHVKPELKQYEGAKMARLAMSVSRWREICNWPSSLLAKEIGDVMWRWLSALPLVLAGLWSLSLSTRKLSNCCAPRTVIRRLGARSVPLPNGNLTMPRMAGGATASYVGEGAGPKSYRC